MLLFSSVHWPWIRGHQQKMCFLSSLIVFMDVFVVVGKWPLKPEQPLLFLYFWYQQLKTREITLILYNYTPNILVLVEVNRPYMYNTRFSKLKYFPSMMPRFYLWTINAKCIFYDNYWMWFVWKFKPIYFRLNRLNGKLSNINHENSYSVWRTCSSPPPVCGGPNGLTSDGHIHIGNSFSPTDWRRPCSQRLRL